MSEDVSFNVHGINADNSVKLGSDAQMVVHFYKRAIANEARSKAEGTPIYEQRDFIKIFHPGEKDVIDRPVKEMDKHRFPQHWAAYQNNKTQAADGTPLEHLYPGNPEIVATLRASHVQTVQQLAGLSDSAAGTIQFGGDHRKKAQQFLEGAEKGRTFHALQKQLQDQSATIKELQDQLTVMQATMRDKQPKQATG